MNDGKANLPEVKTWRSIPQEVKPRAMSKSGKKRYAFSIGKLVGGITFIALTTWGSISLISTIENNPREISQPPVKELVLNTDGVLNREWVVRTLGIPKTATLLELDLPQLQDKLMDSGQVRTVVFAKQFPATLNITVTERSPVARILVQDGPSQNEMLVARDGVVFRGEGYEPTLTTSLPWLAGVKLTRSGGRLVPIQGMEQVSDLITKARYESEHLYPLFTTIDLSRLASDGEIEVRSPECEGLVFSTKADFFRQLALLDYIRDSLAPTPEAPLARMDLTNAHDGIVPVSFKGTAVASAPAGTTAAKPVSKKPVAGQPRVQAAATPARTQTAAQAQAQLRSQTRPAAPSTKSPSSSKPAVRSTPTRPGQASPAFTNLQRKPTQREL